MEKEIKNSIAEAYVAGSFRSDLPEEYGAGVYYKSTNPDSHSETCMNRLFRDAEAAKMQESAGEIEAAKLAVKLYQMEKPMPERLVIYYKSGGICAWAEGILEPEKPKEIAYAYYMQNVMNSINIEFRKVNGDIGAEGHEIAQGVANSVFKPSWYVISEYHKDGECTKGIISEEISYEFARKRMLAAAKERMEMESGEEWGDEAFLDILITREVPEDFPYHVQAGNFGFSGTFGLDYVMFRNIEFPTERIIYRLSPDKKD